MGSRFKRVYYRLVYGSAWQRTRVSELRASLHISTLEGIFATVHIALTQGLFLTNYAIALGCPDWLLGVIDALPFLCMGFAFFSPLLVRRLRSRKRVVVGFSLAHRAAWLALAILLFVDLPQPAKQALMVLTLLLSNAAAVVAGNAWLAWMADLVPASLRGSYYGRRNAALGAVSLAMLLAGSYVLTWFEKRGQMDVGFAVCFIFAVVAALASARTLGRQVEPPPVPAASGRTMRQVFAEVWRTPGVPETARFILCWQFFLGFGAAYFGAHMVRELMMTPFQMGLVGVITSVCALLAMPYWGRLDRKLGSPAVLAGSGLLIGLHIFPWLVTSAAVVWPIYVCGALGGFAWAGFNLSWFNHTQTLGAPELRQHTFGVIGFFQGSAFFAGSILGGVLLALLPRHLLPWEIGPWRALDYFVVFLVSGVGRLIALVFLPRSVHGGCVRCFVLLGSAWLGRLIGKR